VPLGFAEFQYGFMCNLRGNAKEGVKHLQNAIEYHEEAQMLIALGLFWTGIGWGHHLMNDLPNALKYAEKGLQIQTDGVPFKLSITYWLLSGVHLDMGNVREAWDWGERALKVAQDNREPDCEGLLWFLLGMTLQKTDVSRKDQAEEYVLRGIGILEKWGLRPFASQGYHRLGELYADTGQKEKAVKALTKAEAEFKDMGMDYWLRKTQEALARVEGY
jgi:tetratricopeptide (TPR) repeat protein